jgi:hypothetical protein
MRPPLQLAPLVGVVSVNVGQDFTGALISAGVALAVLVFEGNGVRGGAGVRLKKS